MNKNSVKYLEIIVDEYVAATGRTYAAQHARSIIDKIYDVLDANSDLNRLLDLRDEQYFKFCETGLVDTAPRS